MNDRADAPRDDHVAAAHLYDALHREASAERGDAAFYLGLAHEAKGPVLELGCGTGRVLLEIAGAGFPCSGVDPSAAMLAELRRKGIPPSLRLACAPMQSFDLGADRFALIYAAFRSFQHLLTVPDQLACLARVRRHLAPGGIFAFDVSSPELQRSGEPRTPEAVDLRVRHEGEEITRYVRAEHEAAEQRVRLFFRYERRRAGALVGAEHTTLDARYFSRFELEHLLARAGFERVEFYGDFQRAPLTADSEFVIVAR